MHLDPDGITGALGTDGVPDGAGMLDGDGTPDGDGMAGTDLVGDGTLDGDGEIPGMADSTAHLFIDMAEVSSQEVDILLTIEVTEMHIHTHLETDITLNTVIQDRVPEVIQTTTITGTDKDIPEEMSMPIEADLLQITTHQGRLTLHDQEVTQDTQILDQEITHQAVIILQEEALDILAVVLREVEVQDTQEEALQEVVDILDLEVDRAVLREVLAEVEADIKIV